MSATRKCVLVVVIVGLIAVALVVFQPPTWAMVLLGSVTLALLYIVARFGSRFDPLDPRFGSCIPPINTKPHGSQAGRDRE
jgi:hypothetical protein